MLALVNGIHDHGGALVIRGEAGIGKSALLAAASAWAREQGVSVFRTTAVESETRLPFAGLRELLLPFLDRLDGLPEVQRHALEMALGLAPREAVPDIFLIGLATLGLVADVAADGPLLFVIEDAQWIDRSSGMVFGFVARRLEVEPVLMWFAVRAGVMSDVDDAGLAEFDLRGLSEEASARLLEAQASSLPADRGPVRGPSHRRKQCNFGVRSWRTRSRYLAISASAVVSGVHQRATCGSRSHAWTAGRSAAVIGRRESTSPG